MNSAIRFSRKIISLSLVLCIGAAVLTGCGEHPAEPEDVIELHEPKAGDEVAVNTEPAAYRNLYNAEIYDATVYPYVEEYCYESGQKFGSYGALVGDTVEKGDPLVYADNEAVSRRIEAMEEKLRTMTEDYEEYRAESEEFIAQREGELEDLQEILENMEESEPAENVVGSDGQSAENPEHTAWWKEYRKWEGQYNNKELSMETRKEALRQRTELYTLDAEYYQAQLQKLKAQAQEGVLYSQISGKVVAMADYVPGDSIRAGVPVAAVGDLERKYIKCSSYISKYARQRLADLYVVVNGRRYEITYEENGDKAYSWFSLADGDEEIAVGDVAVVVLMRDIREHVLTVPVEAIHSASLQSYVYVLENGTIASRQVQTGMGDGCYREITSGLEEGEKVMVSTVSYNPEAESVVLERGDFQVTYQGNGNLFYPIRSVVNNPVENGAVYFQSYLTGVNQRLAAGDAIASVRVEGDEVELARKETELKRAKERLADLVAQNKEENEDAILQRQENIAEMEEEIASIKADYAVTEICSDAAGILLSREGIRAEDVLKPGSRLAVLADEQTAYLIVDNPKQYLHYGDKVAVIYTDIEGKKRGVEGEVVTLGETIGGTFSSASVVVSLPESMWESVSTITTSGGGSNSLTNFNVVASVPLMENVVLVPKDAVVESDRNTYVYVLTEDGTVLPVSFLAGGANQDYYWVIDGLTEGMKVLCLE